MAADAILVALGTSIFPSTVSYGHFHVTDYGTLSVIGVLVACAAWPVVTWVSARPRWLFLRLAVLVTVVLLLPDVYLLLRHQPPRAVGVLMTMHLAIAVVTYNALVRIAPPSDEPPAAASVRPIDDVVDGDDGDAERPARRLTLVLLVLVAVESALGVVALLKVPLGRPSSWVPREGAAVYVVHATVGFVLAIGAILLVERARRLTRLYTFAAWIGVAGVALAGVGGLLAVSHTLRLVGLLFMFIGPATAAIGYFLPTLDRLERQDTAQTEH